MVRMPDFRGGGGAGGYNHLAGATYNRTKNGNYCIADQCAMWRREPSTVGEVTTAYAQGQRPGFCGLAGRPYPA